MSLYSRSNRQVKKSYFPFSLCFLCITLLFHILGSLKCLVWNCVVWIIKQEGHKSSPVALLFDDIWWQSSWRFLSSSCWGHTLLWKQYCSQCSIKSTETQYVKCFYNTPGSYRYFNQPHLSKIRMTQLDWVFLHATCQEQHNLNASAYCGSKQLLCFY